MIADARVELSFGAYFMLARNVISPRAAFSIVATPTISISGLPAISQPSSRPSSATEKQAPIRFDNRARWAAKRHSLSKMIRRRDNAENPSDAIAGMSFPVQRRSRGSARVDLQRQR